MIDFNVNGGMYFVGKSQEEKSIKPQGKKIKIPEKNCVLFIFPKILKLFNIFYN